MSEKWGPSAAANGPLDARNKKIRIFAVFGGRYTRKVTAAVTEPCPMLRHLSYLFWQMDKNNPYVVRWL